MNRKNKRKNPSTNIKKIILAVLLLVCVFGGIKLVLAYKDDQVLAKKNNTQTQESTASSEHKTMPVVGQKEEDKKITGVDSQKVWNALNTYDYTNGGKKQVFLTFDDGPSLTNTPKILDILKKNDVKGTFFVIGKSLKIDGAPAILKQIYDDGMAIGNHSYSHNYKYLYPKRTLNLANFNEDFEKNAKLINASLGLPNFKTRVIRCPGGQMSWKNTKPLSDYLIDHNMASIDWNGLNGDAEGPKKNAEQLFQEAVKSGQKKNLVVLLMHDTYGKEDTVKSLDKIIKHYKSLGYEFKTLV